ncbi:hypothetical protein GGR57DRAFT_509335 [Xylariaceae sp. FL1272]|nr:hypothetical protein GGR57DRAFT_509335 [Xylariaceae sp. FL1272]
MALASTSVYPPRPSSLFAWLCLCLAAFEPAAAWHLPGLPISRHHHAPPTAATFWSTVASPLPTTSSSTASWWRRIFSAEPIHNDTTLSPWLVTRPKLLASLRDYDGDVVIRLNVSTAAHETALRSLVDRMLLDVWQFTDNHVDIRLPARRVPHLTRALPPDMQNNHTLLISDLAATVAATYPSAAPRLTPDAPASNTSPFTVDDHVSVQQLLLRDQSKLDLADVFFGSYQPLSAMYNWMRLLESMFPTKVRMMSIGQSYEGREITALRVGIQTNEDSPDRLRETILVTGGMHAREWISVSTANYLAWSFIHLSAGDPMVAKILERFDLVFVPVLNPDGYEYTWEVDRLWRKSRQGTNMSICPGFDLDHAFGYQWNSVHHQTEPCSQSYGGDEPFQAIEALRLADWAKNETAHGTRFVGYLDLHSYSQQVLVPYAYSCEDLPPNLEKLTEVAMNLAKHMRLVNGESYTVTSACEGAATSGSHPGSLRAEARGGSAIDYVFHQLHAHYSYQIKLRDTGSYGFLLPSDDIIPTGEEVFQAMKYLGDYLLGNDGHEGWAQDEQTQEHLKDGSTSSELRRRRRGSRLNPTTEDKVQV